MEVSADMPADVRMMHEALLRLRDEAGEMVTIDTDNCGTAMRFLTAFCARMPGWHVILTGCERMRQRPIGQLVDSLRTIGADIRYIGQEGFPPMEIFGSELHTVPVTMNRPLSTQFVSALLLSGIDVQTDARSPYIELTKHCITNYEALCHRPVEADWSAAAFWFEWMALHNIRQPLLLKGLHRNSWQGDRKTVGLFEPLGVLTEYGSEGVVIRWMEPVVRSLKTDFSSSPDLYPAVAMTCHRLGICLEASGTETLRWKESDRIEAMQAVLSGSNDARHDHRIAMALLAADRMPNDIQCISKSYPLFVEQLSQINNI